MMKKMRLAIWLMWLLPLLGWGQINISAGNGGSVLIGGSGGGGGNCGSLSGDTTSTNCGSGNLVGNTGTSMSVFGYNNVLNANSNNIVTVLGVNNLNYPMGTEDVAIGDSNMNGTSTDFGNYDVALGYDNISNSALSDSICMGGYTCSNSLYNNFAGNGERVIAFGNNAADNLGYAPLDIVAIGRGAASQMNGYQGSFDALTDFVCIGDSACNNSYATSTTATYYDIVAIGASAANGYGPGSTEITAVGTAADKQCGSATCTGGIPVPLTVTGVTAIGSQAGTFNQANYLTAVGYGALGSNTAGAGSGYYNTGVANTGLGAYSLIANSTGQYNVAVGAYAGADGFVSPSTWGNSNHTGSQNTWVGYDSGPSVTTQLSNTIALGYQAHNTASNQTVIGNSSMTQTILYGIRTAGTVYSAAGTALPTCGAGIKGSTAIVSDATTPTYMGAYTSGGTITAEVICSYNGSVYSWLTH